MTESPAPAALTVFQVQVARLFFSLPAAEGFLLAGGAALVVHGLTQRPTQDLDLFTKNQGGVAAARGELETAAIARGWSVTCVRESATFCRLLVHGDDELVVDLALDAPPNEPPTVSAVGPTFAPAELAGRKLLALFDRAAARDFADVYALSKRFSTTELIRRATEVDAGFDTEVLAQMIGNLGRFADKDIPVEGAEVADLRAFFAVWAAELGN